MAPTQSTFRHAHSHTMLANIFHNSYRKNSKQTFSSKKKKEQIHWYAMTAWLLDHQLALDMHHIKSDRTLL